MCRFLLAKSKESFEPQKLLEKFAAMSQKSKALDGDWQGDGWGVSTKQEDGTWQTYTSLSPIWEEKKKFADIPRTTHVLVHARSASFPTQKGILEYNQPYVQHHTAFVFNGLLKGVSFPTPLAGVIGAQKIWSLIQQYLQQENPKEALEKTVEDLKTHTKKIQALNIGISDGTSFWVYNQFAAHPDYYTLHCYQDTNLSFIVSEPLDGYRSNPVQHGEIIKI